MKKVHSNLKGILERYPDISLRMLAEKTGESRETIRKFYHDELDHFPRRMLDSICNSLGVSIHELLIEEIIEEKEEG